MAALLPTTSFNIPKYMLPVGLVFVFVLVSALAPLLYIIVLVPFRFAADILLTAKTVLA